MIPKTTIWTIIIVIVSLLIYDRFVKGKFGTRAFEGYVNAFDYADYSEIDRYNKALNVA